MNRHARQQAVPGIGPEGQARIAAAHALVIGAGGLGVPVLQYLTGAGMGRITLLDPDRVEVTNLHRQPLYAMSDIGRPKALAAAEALARLDPGLRIAARPVALDAAMAPALVAAADVVLDCADSHAASYILSDCCLALGRPLIHAAALGMSGHVAGLCGGAPSLRALFPDPTAAGQTCAEAGVLGPVVGMLGCLQAQMALQVVLGWQPSPLGLFTALRDGRLTQFRFDGAPERDGPRLVARAMLRPDDLVIDLRPEAEAPRKATPDALRLPGYGATGPLPRPGARAVLACRSGLRAWRAANELARRWNGEIALLALGEDET